jgi:molybdate transport system regulatory protein
MWLGSDTARVFGEGPYRLLRGVRATGSLKEAADDIGMAYSRARRVIGDCEKALGFALVYRKRGGVSGGGSEVTAEALELMKEYELIRADMENAIRRDYEKHFGEPVEAEVYTVRKRRR